jgi:hypothetical protein
MCALVATLPLLAAAGLWSAGPRAGASEPPEAPEARTAPAPAIRYDRDVRPILSDRCFHCHGVDPAHRKAGLRLDRAEDATAPRKGGAAIVPGDPETSLLWQRVSSREPDMVMPPPESGRHALTPEEQRTLRTWIEQGAVYEPHWAFTPPRRPVVPSPADPSGWCRTTVDRFVLERLRAAGLEPSAEAPRAVLARRVFLDLTGLPPTPEELRAFVEDARRDAYERLVDTLLTEEPYRTRTAERLATPWMDLARYADTSGIHMDAGRQMWAWRDWVIAALRDDMPYDRFVVEQLAGDLLPGATDAQRIATGFHRNHVTSDEGGAIDAEYLLEYAVDRVNTTGAVFLGLTVGCARCHDHKFDPITQEDFYGLLAFFNSNEEPGIYSQVPDANRALEPYLEIPTAEQRARLAALDEDLRARRAERENPAPEDSAAFARFREALRAAGTAAWTTATPVSAVSMNGAELVPQPDGSILARGANPATDVHALTVRTPPGQRLILLEMLEDASLGQGRTGRAANGNAALTGVEVEAVSAADPARRVRVPLTWAWADVEQPDGDFAAVNALDPSPARAWAPNSHLQPGRRALLLCAEAPFGFEEGTDLVVRLRYESQYALHAFGRVRVRTAPADAALLARLPAATGSWHVAGPFPAASGPEAYDARHGPERAAGVVPGAAFAGRPWRHAPSIKEGEPAALAEGTGAEYVGREIWSPDERDLALSLGSDDGIQVFMNGALAHEHRVDRGVAPDQERVVVHLRPGRNTLVCKVVNTGGPGGFFHREERAADVLPRAATVLALPEDAASPEALARGTEAWRSAFSPAYRALSERIAALEKERATVAAGVARTMVMRDRAQPTETFVMTRGLYDKPDRSRPVQRAVPAALGALAPDAPRTRLGLAEWIVSPANPLTARVTVNRLWELLFGRGLVRTSDDFGYQGEWPTHPELLDWLAVEFREGGWDVRRMLRLLVTSGAYRQASPVRPDAAAVDAENRLLASFPRQRLSAEAIRDQALHVSGLLVERAGGPSVKPYQPEGLWQEVAMPQSNTRAYVQGTGEALWRRSLYTYWKRAAPPPSMLVLDAPTRESCTTRRLTTNTPLQALVLWNDPQFVEAARVLAARVLLEPGDDAARLRGLVERCTASAPSPRLAAALAEALAAYRARYRAAPEDAARLVAVGAAPRPEGVPAEELAAWTLVANAILSSDAAIVKD